MRFQFGVATILLVTAGTAAFIGVLKYFDVVVALLSVLLWLPLLFITHAYARKNMPLAAAIWLAIVIELGAVPVVYSLFAFYATR